jgi:glycosyltransferase involved in cell wall biosynthesis
VSRYDSQINIIPPIPKGVERPLWSVMIPTYNCDQGYLRETLTSVLMQDPGSDVMEIVVVDNHSTKNDPEAIVKELGKGRVRFFRQTQNFGRLKNHQTCLELSRGKLIHTLDSDDVLRPGFYEKMTKVFTQNPGIGAAFCRCILSNEHGNWQGLSDLEIPQSGVLPQYWLKEIAELCRIPVPSLAVVRREVYETIGGWDASCGLSADWEFWVRLFTYYPLWFEVEPLAIWRNHSNSANSSNAKNSIFIQENFKTVEAILSYLPDEVHSKVSKIIKRNCAFLALESAESKLKLGETAKGLSLLQQALRYSRSRLIFLSASRIILQNPPLVGSRKSGIGSKE